MPGLFVIAVVFLFLASSSASACEEPGFVDGGGLCLAVTGFGPETGTDTGVDTGVDTLVVLLHGDVSGGGAADYHIERAQDLATALPTAHVVAMVRPGYPAGDGRRSEGEINGRRDHYTARNNRAIGAAVAALRERVGAARVVLVGHSGGAAMAGAIIGREPDLVDLAVLVACPCDVSRWRRDRGRSAWRNSESPSSYVDALAEDIEVIAITGSRDGNTRSRLARDYVEAVAARGIAARFVEVDGGRHGLGSLWPTVRAEVIGALNR